MGLKNGKTGSKDPSFLTSSLWSWRVRRGGKLDTKREGGGNIDLERAMGHIGALWTRILVVA